MDTWYTNVTNRKLRTLNITTERKKFFNFCKHLFEYKKYKYKFSVK